MKIFNRAILLFLLCLLWVGCSDGFEARMPVSGKVTIDGKPLAECKVTFMPKDTRRPSNAITDENGLFSDATTFSPGDGVLIGEHWVAITPIKPPPMPGEAFSSPGEKPGAAKKYVAPVPFKYGMPKESGLTATVSSGETNEFTFELDSKFK